MGLLFKGPFHPTRRASPLSKRENKLIRDESLPKSSIALPRRKHLAVGPSVTARFLAAIASPILGVFGKRLLSTISFFYLFHPCTARALPNSAAFLTKEGGFCGEAGSTRFDRRFFAFALCRCGKLNDGSSSGL